jgi:hypothetical protein
MERLRNSAVSIPMMITPYVPFSDLPIKRNHIRVGAASLKLKTYLWVGYLP